MLPATWTWSVPPAQPPMSHIDPFLHGYGRVRQIAAGQAHLAAADQRHPPGTAAGA